MSEKTWRPEVELLGGQNCFPCSHLSEFFDVPAGCVDDVVTLNPNSILVLRKRISGVQNASKLLFLS